MKYLLAAGFLLMACGTAETTENSIDNYLQYTGSIEVIAPGSRSETILLEDIDTGEKYALVGDIARELSQQYGMTVIVTAIPTDEGWSIRSELQKLRVIEYVLMIPERGSDE